VILVTDTSTVRRDGAARVEFASTDAKESTMVGTRSNFTSEQAPCGKQVGGQHYRDRDDDGLVIYDQHYDCGCRRSRHQYHDGSIRESTVRHDGKVLLDGPGPDQGK
jgi:hypothetical protein